MPLRRTLLPILLSWAFAAAAMAQQRPFAGGQAAGSTVAESGQSRTLAGQLAQLTLYFGGPSDGATTDQSGNMQLSGQLQPMVLYFGHTADGWATAAATQEQTLNGEKAILSLFEGGEADGADRSNSEVVTLSGITLDLTMYKGASADGWATAQLPEALALDGQKHAPTLFRGAAADGWAQAEILNQTLAGEPLKLIMYNGGQQDGFATDLMPERGLDGLAYTPTLYFGAESDGWATALISNQTLDGEARKLVMFMGARADGWATVASESQSLDGGIEKLILFRGGNGQGHRMALFTPDVPLPVELSSFGAYRRPDNLVTLHWTTASELHNAGFEVWRQNSPQGSWSQVGYQEGNGTSYTTTHYTFLDADAPAATVVYRLRQLDLDGTATFSKAVAVPGTARPAKPAAWPVPTRDYLTVQAASAPSDASLTLYSTEGRLLARKTFRHQTRLDLRHLPAGLYLLHITQEGNGTAVLKVIVAP